MGELVLRPGRCYRRRDGQTIGPLELTKERANGWWAKTYPFSDPLTGLGYRTNGQILVDNIHSLDLVNEVRTESDIPNLVGTDLKLWA